MIYSVELIENLPKYLSLKLFWSSVLSLNVVAKTLTFLSKLSNLLSFILRASINISVFPVPALPHTNSEVIGLLSTENIFIIKYQVILEENTISIG